MNTHIPSTAGLGLALLLLAGCASQPPAPAVIKRLDPAEMARIEAARRTRPFSLDEIVDLTRSGMPTPVLLDQIRVTGTRHALTPAQVAELRQKGVAQEVLDAVTEAQARWAQDQAAAERVRRDTSRAAAEDRARAEAEERARRYNDPYRYGYPYAYPYAAPYGYPAPRFGIGWGTQIRR